MKPNTNEEVKEAILIEVKKIAEEEYKKAKIMAKIRYWWVGGFIAGYLYRVIEVMKQDKK